MPETNEASSANPPPGSASEETIPDLASIRETLESAKSLSLDLRLSEADALLQEVSPILDSLPEDLRMEFFINRSICSGRMGNMAQSLKVARDATRLAEKLGKPRSRLLALKLQGNCLSSLSEPSLALRAYQDALGIAKQENAEREIAALYNNLGALHTRLGDLPEARACYELAHSLHEAGGRISDAIRTRVNLAIVLFREGQLEEARARFEALRGEGHALDDPENLCLSIWGLADIAAEEGRMDTAESLFEDLFARLSRHHLQAWLAEAHLEWGEYLARAGQDKKALVLLESARTRADSLGIREFLIRAHREMAGLHEKNGLHEEAFHHLSLSTKLEKETATALGDNRIQALRIIHETDRAHYSAEIQSLRNKELSAALEEARQQHELADEANRLKSEILKMAAHDLRNPIGGIIGLLDLAILAQSKSEGTSYVSRARDEAASTLSLLERLLDAAALEEGRVATHPEPLDFIAVLEKILSENILEKARRKGQFISCDEVASSSVIEADPARCRQILDNLLSNAVKYSPTQATIRYGTRLENRFLVLWIRDEGPGIPEDQKDRIFKPFARLPSSVPTAGEASNGLGLSIARHLTEAHGGSLHVESDGLGHGSTFFLKLPFSQDKR